jgi:hypothetical protein
MDDQESSAFVFLLGPSSSAVASSLGCLMAGVADGVGSSMPVSKTYLGYHSEVSCLSHLWWHLTCLLGTPRHHPLHHRAVDESTEHEHRLHHYSATFT